MARDRDGRRRLSEVGLLRRSSDGSVRVSTCWHCESGYGPGADALHDLMRARGRP
ncbi:conjugal transfer protein TrbB [Mycolicibacterium sp.]|uniref:conjugal transfer protein TrbB n=1 Tax=Mycolicibacterium sp. TaxID=2320850 RepID=UPI003D0DDBE6